MQQVESCSIVTPTFYNANMEIIPMAIAFWMSRILKRFEKGKIKVTVGQSIFGRFSSI